LTLEDTAQILRIAVATEDALEDNSILSITEEFSSVRQMLQEDPCIIGQN
jgi:hypothetical protein